MASTERRLVFCPHCAQPLLPMRYGAAFGPIAVRIIDAVDRAGPAGIACDDLCKATYNNNNNGSMARLRSYISQINTLIGGSGVAIRSDRNVYRIVTRDLLRRRA